MSNATFAGWRRMSLTVVVGLAFASFAAAQQSTPNPRATATPPSNSNLGYPPGMPSAQRIPGSDDLPPSRDPSRDTGSTSPLEPSSSPNLPSKELSSSNASIPSNSSIPASADEEFKMMDQNRDNKITAAEHAAGGKSMFRSMDANRDGQVTGAEMDAAQAGREPSQASNQKGLSSAQKIKVIDKNGDGQLTAAEHAAGTQRMFVELDTNKDGVLSMAELRAGHDKYNIGKADTPRTSRVDR